MSFLEIKEQVASLSAEERLDLAGLLAHLGHADDPQYRADLDRKLAEMDGGKKFGASELERFHRELIAQNR